MQFIEDKIFYKMYKQFILLTFILFFTFNSEQGGKVVYEIVLDNPTSNSKPETSISKKVNNQINHYSGFLDKLETELIFSDKYSHYKTNYMDIDSRSIPKYIKVIFNINDEYFAELSQKSNFRLEEIEDKRILVKTENEKLNWKITNEVKLIQGIKVKKAVYVSNSKKYPKKIYVWFAPSIPHNFGPAEFSFFPGLVLEVNVISQYPYTLKAKQIITNRKFKVKSIPKLEILNQDKLDEYYLKMRSNQKEILNNN